MVGGLFVVSLRGGHFAIIARPRWQNPVYVPVSQPSASWAVSDIGVFSAHLPAARAHALGFDNLKDLWIRWDHPTMGIWAGVIKRNPTEINSGVMELSADSFHVRMKGVRTPTSLQVLSGSPGQLALRLLTMSATDKRLWFDDIAASASGPALRLELRGDDLYSAIESLANENDHEFDITINDDGTIDWAFKRRIGRDKRGSVLLVEGVNVLGGQIAPTTDGLVNDILAVSDEQDWTFAKKRVVANPDSIDQYERIAVTRRYTGSPGGSSLVTRANQDLAIESYEAVPVSITMQAQNPLLSAIRQGDTVRFWSSSQNRRYWFRVMSRSFDGSLAKLAGDCVDEETTQ